jgi:hypothetical protein
VGKHSIRRLGVKPFGDDGPELATDGGRCNAGTVCIVVVAAAAGTGMIVRMIRASRQPAPTS